MNIDEKIVGSLFVLLFTVIIATILTLTYKSLKPANQNKVVHAPNSVKLRADEINFENLESKLLNKEGTYYLWFCDQDDDNCTYVENEFITPILNKLKIDEFADLQKVNFTKCPFSKQKLLDKYNVDSTLAFVKVTVKNDDIKFTDSLTWTSENEFTYKDLKDWLYEHDIWQNAYQSNSNN